MAITVTVDPTLNTTNTLIVAAVHDGNATNTVTVPNATLVDDLPAGPLKALLSRTYTSQGDARLRLLYNLPTLAGGYGVSHGLEIFIMARTGVAAGWGVDVNIDGAGLPTLVISLGAQVAATAYYRISHAHSITS